MVVSFPHFPIARWLAGGLLLAGALPLSGCLESAAPGLIPRQPALALDFPVGDSAVGLNYLPISVGGTARTYAGFRSLRVFVSRDGGAETLAHDLTPDSGTVAVNIGASVLPGGAARATIRTELVDAFGYRLERTLRVRLISGLPLALNYAPNTPDPPTELARGAAVALPLQVLSSAALRELRIYEQLGASAPRLLRTVAGAEFTHPNNVPILWDLPFTYAAPTGVRARQDVTVRFDLASVSGLTTSRSFTYQLLP